MTSSTSDASMTKSPATAALSLVPCQAAQVLNPINELTGAPCSRSFTIGRPDVKLLEHGAPVSSFMGFNTWAAWQGTNDKAAVAGDFVMLASEVEDVIKALVENGFEIVALHNHMINEEPK